MTVLVGIHCKDGIVIGSDSSATFTQGIRPVIEQAVRKIDIINDNVIVAGTGEIGLGQRFKCIIETAWNEKVFQNHYIEVGKILSQRSVNDFIMTNAKPGAFGALIAFSSSDRSYLCEFSITNFQPEFKEINRLWYVSMGGGQSIADPFLAFIRDIFWTAGAPNCQEGILAATWVLDHTIQINPGGINGPINIAVLKRIKGKFQAMLLENGELEEHKQNISEMKKYLQQYRYNMVKGNEATPDIPT